MSNAPTHIGPYVLSTSLGQGSTGTVYRARHALQGHEVALKTVRLPHAQMLTTIRHEIHMLSRLDHPGIVKILEHGVHQGNPWYAMELVQGTSLREYTTQSVLLQGQTTNPTAIGIDTEPTPIPFEAPLTSYTMGYESWDDGTDIVSSSPLHRDEESATTPQPGFSSTSKLLPLSQVLSLIHRLCEPLAFLHGEGFVHCDLKPENIIIRPDGSPVLIDFGLLQRFRASLGRETIDATAQRGGTPMYMAPEQVLQAHVDARADIYALGCIFYELLTGTPPFQGKSREVLAQHLFGNLKPPSSVVETLPPEVDQLVMQLLAREVDQRLGYVDTVAAQLEHMGVTRTRYAYAPPAKIYLYPPGLVGRSSPLKKLQKKWGQIDKEQGQFYWIGGESGIGKTRLAAEFARWAQQKKARVITSACLEKRSNVLGLFLPFLVAVADDILEKGQQEQERLLGEHIAALGMYEESIAALSQQPQQEAPDRTPQQIHRALCEALHRTLHAFAVPQPVLLVMDDLQWADDLSLSVLHNLLQEGLPSRVMVVGTYRSEEVSPRLQNLLDIAPDHNIRLKHLDADSVKTILGEMLCLEEPPQSFARYLSQHSGGNPLFLAEYIHAAVEDGLFWRDNEGRWHFSAPQEWSKKATLDAHLPLPLSLQELLQRRLDRLSPTARLYASCVAVLGRAVPVSLLQLLTETDEWNMVEVLRELQQGKVLQQNHIRQVRFEHDQIRSMAYALMSLPVRSTLHRKAAECLEESADIYPDFVHDVGDHWNIAGQPDKAREGYVQAAKKARQRNAFDEAIRLYQKALSLEANTAHDTIRLLHTLGEVYTHTGDTTQALDHFRLITNIARQHNLQDEEAKSLYHEAVTLAQIGQFEQAHRVFKKVLAIYQRQGDIPQQGKILGNLANIAHEQGNPQQAQEMFHEALELLRQSGDRRREGIVLGNLANVFHSQGKLREASAYFEQALAIHREQKNSVSEALTLANLGLTKTLEGQYVEAMSLLQQSLITYRALRHRRGEGFALGNLAFNLHLQGKHDRALEFFPKAIKMMQRTQTVLFEGVFRTYQHMILRRTGASAETLEPLLEEAHQCFSRAGQTPYAILTFCEEGHLNLLKGKSADAQLQKAQEIAASCHVPADASTEYNRAIERLKRALQALPEQRKNGESSSTFP
ncbi:MAG: tetratricopeptide repeat protein [Deltaproteobacteria bacterium]|nr:MAG: tetratricopeptide repeat protein [Deltaproteobacteria bacterium]